MKLILHCSEICNLTYTTGVAAFTYESSLARESFNLQEYELRIGLSCLYQCVMLRDFNVGRCCNLDAAFMFKLIVALTSFSAVLIQFNSYVV